MLLSWISILKWKKVSVIKSATLLGCKNVNETYSLREISRNLKTNSPKPFRSQDNVLEITNITITRVCVLQCDRENLKYFRNVYCVMTNHSKDQDM